MPTKKKLILTHHLILHNLKLGYSDQLFGYAWALVNPLVYIFSYWFFAYVGLKGGSVGDIPYVVWLVPGVLIYRVCTTVISKAPIMLTSNAMLIKDVNFDVRLIPIVETFREIYEHIIVMAFMFFGFVILAYTMTGTWDYLPSIYYINFIYYWITAAAFLVAISYVLSAVGLLFRDTKNIVRAILVPLFWMTPVLFPVENGIKPALEKIEMMFNPLYYFIHGYRNTFLYDRFFYEDILYNLYIWIVIVLMVLFARKLWKFLTPVIADLV